MRILFVTSRFPWPLRRGDQLRAWHQLRELGGSHSLRLVALAEHPPDAEALAAVRPLCESLRVVPLPAYRSLAGLPLRWLAGRPLQCGLYDSVALARAVADELVGGVDLVHLQLARLDALVSSVPKHPLYVDLVDALSLSTERRARRTRAPLRFLLEIEARRIRRVEEVILRRAEGAAVVSEADARALGAPDHLSVVPLGVDGGAFPFDGRPREGHTVAFTGNLGYFANVDAVTWFVQSVWPLVRAGVPNACLELIGARPHRAVRRLATVSSGVTLRGAVPDMGLALRGAAVAVAPLLAGAGQQIKVLEAMASGTPVVATNIVAQGLGAASRAILVADDSAAFARQVIALLTDRPRAEAQAAAAAREIQQRHTWTGSARLLDAGWHAARQRFEAKSRR